MNTPYWYRTSELIDEYANLAADLAGVFDTAIVAAMQSIDTALRHRAHYGDTVAAKFLAA